MRKMGWRKLTAMLTALLMMLNTAPLSAIAETTIGGTPDSESQGVSLWKEQDLYSVASINGKWYRLARKTIYAKSIDGYRDKDPVPASDYDNADYDFSSLVITYDGEQYYFRTDGSAKDPQRNYYTVSPEYTNRTVEVRTKIGGGGGYLVPESQQYGDLEGIKHFHRGYLIKLDKASNRTYTVRFLNANGNSIQTLKNLKYGATVEFTGVTPTKGQTADTVYTFAGWNPAISDGKVTVTGDADYTAVFEETARTYEIIWKDEEGTVIEKTRVAYGETPSFNYAEYDHPAHDDANYIYTFEGWNPEPVPVTGNATYRAKVSKTGKTSDQDLYIMVRTEGPGSNGNKYYRFDRLIGGITTTNAAITKKEDAMDESTYQLHVPANYFNNIVFTVKGVDYQYSETELSGEHDAYYTIRFFRVGLRDRIHEDPTWFDDESGWVGTAKSTYPENPTNEMVGFHVDYVATLHPSTMPAYSVTFVDEDGTTILKRATRYQKGTKAEAIEKPDDPTKEAADGYSYTFAGWDPEVSDVTGDVTYKATYSSTAGEYTISFVNDDGTTVLQSETLSGGAMPEYKGETPEKAEDQYYIYSFSGWSPEISAVTADETYVAQYDAAIKDQPLYNMALIDKTWYRLKQATIHAAKPVEDYVAGVTVEGNQKAVPESEYTIDAYDFSGMVISISDVSYEYWDGNPETKPDDYTNYFTVGYENENAKVVASLRKISNSNLWLVPEEEWPDSKTTSFKRNFKFTLHKATGKYYTVKFVDEDGTVLQTDSMKVGATPAYTGKTPVKAADAQYTYTFAGWDNEIAAVTGNATYKATYGSTVNEYTIRFVNEDGTELQSGSVAYGQTPAYTGKTPVKAADAQYTYTFAGWDNEIAAVTGNATYTATYGSTVNEYTIRFVNEDGTELQSGSVAYGQTPAYTGETPVKAADAQYTYTFAGWDAEIAAVTGDATYTATYGSTANVYTITFNSNGGSATAPITQDFATAVTAPADPTREGYTFTGWDTAVPSTMPAENLTITANWTINQYTITFNSNGGRAVAPITQDYATTVTAPADPTREGYTFTGWDAAIPATMPAQDLILTAQWTPNPVIPEVSTYNLVIHYQADGDTAAPDFHKTYQEGATYTVMSPALAGYDADQATVTGTITGDIEITVHYSRQDAVLTIQYLTLDGTRLAEDQVVTMKFGDTYRYEAPAFENYETKTEFVEGTMTRASMEIIIQYLPISEKDGTQSRINVNGTSYIVINEVMTPLGLGEVFRGTGETME